MNTTAAAIINTIISLFTTTAPTFARDVFAGMVVEADGHLYEVVEVSRYEVDGPVYIRFDGDVESGEFGWSQVLTVVGRGVYL